MFKRKFTTVLALILSMVLLFASGITVGAQNGDLDNGYTLETRTINVASFNHVRIGGNWDVVYVEAPSHSIRVVMPTEWFARYNFNVVSRTLRVERNLRNRLTRWDGPARPRMYVYAPALDSMNLSGSADATSLSALVGRDFALNISGNARANLAVDISRNLVVNSTGMPEATLSGTTHYLSINGAGISNIHAFDLEARYARSVALAGLGVVEVTAVETLNVRVAGTARVYYRGNPTISSRTTGSGRLIDAN